jgi:hypothetical protein
MGGSFSGNTTGAPFSNGNPAATCGLGPGPGSCINGCRSDFYRITTHGSSGTIQALACRDAAATAAFYPRIYVWEGNSTVCSTFSCVNGTGTCAAARRMSFERLPGIE